MKEGSWFGTKWDLAKKKAVAKGYKSPPRDTVKPTQPTHNELHAGNHHYYVKIHIYIFLMYLYIKVSKV